jgi:hypothetical protein
LGGTIGLIVAAYSLLGVYLLDCGLQVASSGPTLPHAIRIGLVVTILVLFFSACAGAYGLDSGSFRAAFGGGPRAQAWAATEALTNLADAGVRPQNWDRALVEQATAHVRPFDGQTAARRFAYFNALDLGDVERAERELYLAFRCVEAVHKGSFQAMLRPVLQAEAAFFEARYRANPDKAENWLLKSNSGYVPKRTWLRAHAALLRANGDNSLAQKTAREGLAVAMRFQPTGIAILEDEWLSEMADATEPAPRNDGPASLKPITLVADWIS